MSKKKISILNIPSKAELLCPFLNAPCVKEQCGCYYKNGMSCSFPLVVKNTYIYNCNFEKLIAANS